MGSSGSKDAVGQRYDTALEAQAVRAAIPRGLQDEKAKQLKYELHWCLTRNDWYFTAGAWAQLPALLFFWQNGQQKHAAMRGSCPCTQTHGRVLCGCSHTSCSWHPLGRRTQLDGRGERSAAQLGLRHAGARALSFSHPTSTFAKCMLLVVFRCSP